MMLWQPCFLLTIRVIIILIEVILSAWINFHVTDTILNFITLCLIQPLVLWIPSCYRLLLLLSWIIILPLFNLELDVLEFIVTVWVYSKLPTMLINLLELSIVLWVICEALGVRVTVHIVVAWVVIAFKAYHSKRWIPRHQHFQANAASAVALLGV